jgi:hypothetical protein
MTYDYAARTAWVDGLDGGRVPNSYDLCTAHADGMAVPRGWERHDRRFGQLELAGFHVLGPVEVPARV